MHSAPSHADAVAGGIQQLIIQHSTIKSVNKITLGALASTAAPTPHPPTLQQRLRGPRREQKDKDAPLQVYTGLQIDKWRRWREASTNPDEGLTAPTLTDRLANCSTHTHSTTHNVNIHRTSQTSSFD